MKTKSLNVKTGLFWGLCLLFSLGTSLTSCSKDDDGPVDAISLDAGMEKIQFLPEAAEKSVTFVSQPGWTATVTEGAEWITLDKKSGEAGKGTLKVKVVANEGRVIRKGSIELVAGTAKTVVVVEQNTLSPSIVSEPADLSIQADEPSVKVGVTSNVEWELVSKPDWMTISEFPETTKGDVELTITVTPALTALTGEIVLRDKGDKTDKAFKLTIPVTVSAAVPSAVLNKDKFGANAYYLMAPSANITIKNNVGDAWRLTVLEGTEQQVGTVAAAWVTLEDGTDGNKVLKPAAYTDTKTIRYAYVYFAPKAMSSADVTGAGEKYLLKKIAQYPDCAKVEGGNEKRIPVSDGGEEKNAYVWKAQKEATFSYPAASGYSFVLLDEGKENQRKGATCAWLVMNTGVGLFTTIGGKVYETHSLTGNYKTNDTGTERTGWIGYDVTCSDGTTVSGFLKVTQAGN